MNRAIFRLVAVNAWVLSICVAGCTSRMGSTTVDSSPLQVSFLPTTTSSDTFILTPRNTRITFVGTALLNSHEGTFNRFIGRFDCPDSRLRDAHLIFEIDMNSVATEIPLLTKHLREDDFFDVQKYPRARFVSSRIEASPVSGQGNGMVVGELTLHGHTKTISFPANFTLGPRTFSIEAKMTIRQSDFKMESSRTTTDDVPVRVSANMTK